MSDHAIFAPSAMARNLACPPSAALSAGLPERNSSQAAEEGSRVHAVIETAIRTGELPAPVLPWLEPPNKNMPDREVARRVFDYIAQLGPGQLMAEHKVTLFENVWGTLDISHLADIITVFDYKNGGFDVLARDNKQLLTYAATFLDSHPTVQWFRLVIFQPNSWGSQGDEGGFKQHVHSRAEVEKHRQDVLAAVNYSGPPKPGPHCRWCNAFYACPAMSQDAYFLMAAISRASDPAKMSPHEILRMLRLIRGVGDMQKTLEQYLTDALKMGAVVEGAALGNSTKWEQWNDDRHAAAHLYQAYGPRGVKPLTVAAARKLGTVGEEYAKLASHRAPPEQKVKY